ncbi:MAG: Riboflavin biosynthesis protein RibD [Bacteroidetes bacterium ADurb.Bin408]|nr:MAG: Riboflavin biosynthesis protein RibD [Bacteroidetes bacterium ADurb.Bin408]
MENTKPLDTDILFMQRCIQIAQNGLGFVAPNPMVGCVIVHKDVIIGEGYHKQYGEAHAEVHAINAVSDKSLLSRSTLYVNLEPCAHYGKTPPCTDLIIKHKLPRVVIANTDSNPLVAGKGIKKLTEAGCKVTTGVLEKEGRFLNRRFFTFHEQKRPYLILKWAESADGFIDKLRDKNAEIKPNWITSERTRAIVHKWRTEEAAIMAGTNAVLNDNPSLTARDWKGKNPVRVILDRMLLVPISYHVYSSDAPTFIFNTIKSGTQDNVKFIRHSFDAGLIDYMLSYLYESGLQSLIIEGGACTLNAFINKNLWDEARVFKGQVYYTKGVAAPALKETPDLVSNYGGDILFTFYNKNPMLLPAT